MFFMRGLDMSRILVTGAAGFIGSHLFGAFCESNHEIWCLDNDWKNYSNPFRVLSPQSARDWKVDVLDVPAMIESFFSKVKFDAVIHLAAQPSIQESWKKADYDAKVNILGTINLLGLCQKYNVKRFVFASTSAVYSPDSSGVYGEYHLLSPSTPYGISKLAAELYIKISGISYAILRLGNVYGPRQVPLGENQLIPRYLAHVFQGKRFVVNGDGKQRRDYIYVKDVANAFLKAVESKETGVFNISSGYSISVLQILNLLNALFERHDQPILRWKHGPAKKGELRSVTLQNDLAKTVLDWEPETGLVKGLWETIAAWPK